MATENKRINTRLLLKYDTYDEWRSKNPVLLAGEVAIATIASGNTQQVNSVTAPQVLIKVGDGTSNYNALPFASGLAADVYEWAKASTKPTYSANEIQGLSNYITTAGDTNNEYQIVAVDATTYKYKLQGRAYANGAWGEWTDVYSLDLSNIDTRLDVVETKTSDNESAIAKLNGNASTEGSVLKSINDKIATLDATVSQDAGADGLSLSITETDGVITAISGSIAANTYDAHGSAKAVQGDTTSTVKEAMERANAAYDLADAAQTAQEVSNAITSKIQTLDYNDYAAGNATGATISFVGTVGETDGIISATKRDLVFNSAYDPTTNKAATMADVTTAVADLTGAMHFEGVKEFVPTDNSNYSAGDVIIVGLTEYVFDGSAWVELGNEGTAAALISGLDMPTVTVGADKTLVSITQNDGIVSTEAVAIQIAKSQVTGLEDSLTGLANADSALDERVTANEGKIATIQGQDTTKSMRTVASEVATAAIQGLDSEAAEQSGKYVASVKLTDGVISATYGTVPTIPNLSHSDSTATTPTEDTITVVTDISVSGYTITDTRSNQVVTKTGLNKAIQALDADKDVSTNKHVMTGVTQVDGAITSIDEVKLADVAFSGNIADLVQTAETYVVFDCGSATKNI